MAGLYTEAVLDPETSTLLRNASISVYKGDGSGDLATIYDDAEATNVLAQPLQTDNNGMLTFYADGGYYELAREGGTPVKIQVVNHYPLLEENAPTLVTTVSSEVDFDGACYFSGAYQTFEVISGNYTVPTPDPSSRTLFYSGASNITVTLPGSVVRQNWQLTIFNTGLGTITIAKAGSATLTNIDSHTKIAPKGMGVVVQTGEYGGDPAAYQLGGNTTA